MSQTASDDINLRETLARIDRTQAETRKLLAEQTKLFAEQEKLVAEAGKFRREHFLAPILAAGILAGAVAGLVPLLLRGWGIR